MTSLTAKANTGSGTDKLAVKVINTDENAAVVFPYLGTAEISDANPMPVSDAGGSLTIDGSVAVTGTVAVTDNSGSLTVDDGGSSLTVDGTVAATQSGTWNVGTVTTITNVVHVDDNASTLSVDDGGGSLTIDGTVAVSGTVAVTDNSGSLTVDAPVGTPVFVRLSDGSAAITTLPVSLASVPSHAVTGAAASGAAVAGNPLLMAGSDGTNARTLRTDSSGYPLVRPYDGTNAMPMMDAAARRGFVGITDGTNTAAVKAASTAAAATDPAVVVSISPNNTVASNFTSIGGVSVSVGSGTVDSGSQRVALATNSPGVNPIVRAQTTVTRPANTTAYAAGDIWSDSTSAPTSGGFTLSSVAKASGGGGVIMGMSIVSTNAPATVLQGEIWVADSAVTNINDNSAFSLSDSDALKIVAKVPFALSNDGVNNGQAFISNLWIPYLCSGSANLRFLIKVLNAYTPASAEQLTVTAWCQEYDA